MLLTEYRLHLSFGGLVAVASALFQQDGCYLSGFHFVHNIAILLDNHHDAFQPGVRNFTKIIFQSLAGVGYDMSCDNAAVFMLNAPAIATVNCYTKICRVVVLLIFTVLGQLLLFGVVSCTYHQWFRSYSKQRRFIASCLFLAGACSDLCRHALMHYLLSQAVLQVGSMLIGQTAFVPVVVKGFLQMSCMLYLSVLF